MDVTELDEALLHYCNRGVADSTRRTYRSGVNRYLSFCCAFGVSTPFPVSELMLCYFITSLAREGIAPATIKTYLAAVRHAQIIQGHPEPRESSALPRLRLVQNGIRRERAESSPVHSPTRLPITPPLLRLLRPPEGSKSDDACLLWAAATVCFFGFFRAGEITVPSARAFDERVHLAWGDVMIGEDNSTLRVFLKRTKTDQYMKGTEVFIGSTDNDLCPVRATREYVARRGSSPGAFFQSAQGVPLSKPRFVELVRAALARGGVPVGGYSGHSFRIGAATAASQAGISDSVIQALGRWASPAFLRYIRTPRERLAQLSNSIAQGPADT